MKENECSEINNNNLKHNDKFSQIPKYSHEEEALY